MVLRALITAHSNDSPCVTRARLQRPSRCHSKRFGMKCGHVPIERSTAILVGLSNVRSMRTTSRQHSICVNTSTQRAPYSTSFHANMTGATTTPVMFICVLSLREKKISIVFIWWGVEGDIPISPHTTRKKYKKEKKRTYSVRLFLLRRCARFACTRLTLAPSTRMPYRALMYFLCRLIPRIFIAVSLLSRYLWYTP